MRNENATIETIELLLSKLPKNQNVGCWSSLNIVKEKNGGYLEIWAGGSKPLCKGKPEYVAGKIQEQLDILEEFN